MTDYPPSSWGPGSGRPPPPPRQPPQPPQPGWSPQGGGYQQQGAGYQQPAPQRPSGVNALAVVSLIAGIVWIFGLGSLVAVITGVIALSQIPRQGQRGRGLAIAGTALGAVGILGAILTFGFLAALDEEFDEKSDDPATVTITAAPTTCYVVTLTSSSGGISQSQQEGCGVRSFPLGQGLGRNVIVTKKDDPGALTAVLVVGGEEKDRQSTGAAFGSVTLSP